MMSQRNCLPVDYPLGLAVHLWVTGHEAATKSKKLGRDGVKLDMNCIYQSLITSSVDHGVPYVISEQSGYPGCMMSMWLV